MRTRDRIIKTAESLILAKGYVGTSIEDILQATGLTKGGFFYHFKSKAELGRAVVEYYCKKDFDFFEELSDKADATTDDPLDALLTFLRLFEEHIASSNVAPDGCIFASYIYESAQFDENIKTFITDGFNYWGNMYIRRLDTVREKYPPVRPVDARELSETIMAIIEGAFIISKSFEDPQIIVRTSRHFRQYLELLFRADVLPS